MILTPDSRHWHPRFGLLRTHSSGHLIIKQRGPYRDMSLHRAIVIELLKEQPSPFWGTTIPEGYVVHHQDHDPKHNCSQNLIVMPWQMHSAITAHGQPREGSKWGRIHGRRTKRAHSQP